MPVDQTAGGIHSSEQKKWHSLLGVTSDLVKRVWEHRNNLVEGFTKRYGVHELVWYELHETMESAIQREKRLKEWKRKWKVQLIQKTNPNWKDLYPLII